MQRIRVDLVKPWSDHGVRYWVLKSQEGSLGRETLFCVNVYMKPTLGFWRRLLVGFRYILGKDSEGCEHALHVMPPEEVEELSDLIEIYREKHDEEVCR